MEVTAVSNDSSSLLNSGNMFLSWVLMSMNQIN